MPISFSSLSGGSNNSGFLVNMGSATFTSAELDQEYAAGGYDISLAIEDATYDIYGLDANGVLSGYTNSASVIFENPVKTIVAYGSVPNQIYTFSFSGGSSSPTSSGSSAGAGAYVSSVNVTDLPDNDDQVTITGGNFDSDLRVWFVGQDLTEYEAKSVSVSSSTEAIATRPDNIINDNGPYSILVKNNDTPVPSGTNAHILSNIITVGQDPTWVTTTFVTPFYSPNQSYSATIQATDPDGNPVVSYSIVSGTLPSGLSLNSSTGEISGTATASETSLITFMATDAGGNTAEAQLTVGYLGEWISYSPQPAKEAEAYSYQLSAQLLNQSQSTEYSIVSGSLPPGLSLGTNGLIQGTPSSTAAGNTYTLTVRALFPGQSYVDQEISIVVQSLVAYEFTTTQNWTSPYNGLATFVLVGGGGGGGGIRWPYSGVASGGGGGFSRQQTISITSGTNFSIQIGSGGTFNTYGDDNALASPNSGGSTSVNGGNVSLSIRGGGAGSVNGDGGASGYWSNANSQEVYTYVPSGQKVGAGSDPTNGASGQGLLVLGSRWGSGGGASGSSIGRGGPGGSSGSNGNPGGVKIYWHE